MDSQPTNLTGRNIDVNEPTSSIPTNPISTTNASTPANPTSASMESGSTSQNVLNPDSAASSTISSSSGIPKGTTVNSNNNTTSSAAAASSAVSTSGTTSPGISTRTLAGSIVGTAIVAALIAAALTLLVVRRRRSRRPSGPVARHMDKQHSRASMGCLGTRGWEQYLPQPADDPTVKAAFSTLIDQLEVHVENYYQDGRRQAVEADAEAALLMLQSTYLPGPLHSLLTQQEHPPRVLIKHCLVHLVLDPDHFLPPGMSALLQIPDQRSVIALPQALSRCRVLFAYVHPPLSADPHSRERLAAAIATAADGFETAFRPWMSRSAAAGRRQNLTAIMESAADFHLMLFSQPCSYEFDWKALPDVSEPVVLPGLVKTSDEHGSPLATAQVLVPLAVIGHL